MAKFQLSNAIIDSTDIIREVVSAIIPIIRIKNVSSVGAVHTLTVCNISYAQPTYSVKIGGNDYVIQLITAWDTMVVKDKDPNNINPITVDAFVLYTPYFFHGTARAVGSEVKNEMDTFKRTPMIWMDEQFTDTFCTDPDDPKERQITASIYALSHQITPGQSTEDAYINVVRPMRALMEEFWNVLKANPQKFDTRNVEFTIQNYYRFGVYVKEKGVDKNIFVDNLAGTGTDLKLLTIWEDGLCKTCRSTVEMLPAIPNMEINNTLIVQ